MVLPWQGVFKSSCRPAAGYDINLTRAPPRWLIHLDSVCFEPNEVELTKRSFTPGHFILCDDAAFFIATADSARPKADGQDAAAAWSGGRTIPQG